MTSQLNPYLYFIDNARHALQFYKGVFGGSLVLSTFGDFGTAMAPASYADRIMFGRLDTDHGLAVIAADAPPALEYHPGNNVAMSLSGDDADELRDYWQKLTQEGTVDIALEKQMWGDEFGKCVDRFGITWMVNITEPQA